MVNMNYCQFENTLRAMQELDFDKPIDELSSSEQKARGRLLELMVELVADLSEQND